MPALVTLALLIQGHGLDTSANLLTMTPASNVVVDPPNSAAHGMLKYAANRLTGRTFLCCFSSGCSSGCFPVQIHAFPCVLLQLEEYTKWLIPCGLLHFPAINYVTLQQACIRLLIDWS